MPQAHDPRKDLGHRRPSFGPDGRFHEDGASATRGRRRVGRCGRMIVGGRMKRSRVGVRSVQVDVAVQSRCRHFSSMALNAFADIGLAM